MSSPSALHSFDTIYPADSVEFCPSQQHRDYFVCGTYLLQKDEVTATDVGEDDGEEAPRNAQTRLGRCWLMKTNDSGHFDALHSFDLPAILDLKWSYSHRDTPRLAIADAVGAVHFYDLHTIDSGNDVSQSTSCNLTSAQVLQCTSQSNICLSLDWSDRLRPDSNDSMIVASISDGSLCTIKQSKGSYGVDSTWHAHEYEPWIAAWNYWNLDIVYSGGDDLTWKTWDLRTDLQSPVSINKRSFEGGVTSIQAHPHVEHIVAIGSYDGRVRLFDTRKPSRPLMVHDIGGGAWRVKWHPAVQRKNDLLVAGMHAGFKVIRWRNVVDGNDADLEGNTGEVIADFQDHSSLAYGVDWQLPTVEMASEGKTRIASCSFYDHVLKTWEADHCTCEEHRAAVY